MTKWIMLAICFGTLPQSAFMQTNDRLEELKGKVQQQLAIPGAQFGVAFKDLQTGKTIFLNEKEKFHAASTMKTPVLVELFKQASLGKFSMDDSILIKNSFRSIVDGSEYSLDPGDDSEPELYKKIGNKITIASLAYDMIINSSNLATNILIELVNPQNVMSTLGSMGAHDMKVLRGVEDSKAYAKGLNNSTTAYDLLVIFDQMANGKPVDSAASRKMISILMDQRFNDIIPALLPPTVKVAHKTGFITGIQHDSGIVFLPDGRKYVLVLLSRFDKSDQQWVIRSMAAVSRLFYDYMSEN